MMLNVYEYALSLSWTPTQTEQGYESHYPTLDTRECMLMSELRSMNLIKGV